MVDSEPFFDDFDGTLNDVLPENIDTDSSDSTGSRTAGWFESGYTIREGTPDSVCLNVVQSELERYCDLLGTNSQTTVTAGSLFEQYMQKELPMVFVELYAGAAFYCACKVNKEAISPDEIVDAGPQLLTRNRLLRRSKRIAHELGLNANLFGDSLQYIDRYCAELDVSEQFHARAREIVERCEKEGLASGKSPTGWAAAAIYLTGKELGQRINQRTISDIANVSEVTIRNRYQEQQAHLERIDSPETSK